jgi:SAM-dependent methyltransferase
MMHRRKLLLNSAAAVLGSLPTLKAVGKGFEHDVEPRGTVGRFERLPRLDLESSQGFYRGFRQWINNSLTRRAQIRAREILKENGIDPKADLPMADVVKLMGSDYLMGLNVHAWESTQVMMWKEIQLENHRQADLYLNELAEAEKLGPGSIELRPQMHIPKYASYEIHLQPGGYVGDPFAGYIYVHGENVVFRGGNYQDEFQQNLSSRIPTPADGQVARVLEQGCSSGQYTIALKDRFPEAEVWGTDVAAPMLRFAHLRSVDLGIETHYMQELSEASNFPDNHFDIVTNNLLFHEVPGEVAKGIINEAYRTLRPGGIFYPIDLFTGNPPAKTAYGKFWGWRDYRWNAEVWRLEYMALDMPAVMREVGFEVNENGPPARRGARRNILGVKPA